MFNVCWPGVNGVGVSRLQGRNGPKFVGPEWRSQCSSPESRYFSGGRSSAPGLFLSVNPMLKVTPLGVAITESIFTSEPIGFLSELESLPELESLLELESLEPL